MIRIGKAWEDGIISVAHEHMITHIVQQRFNQFFRIFPTSPNLPKVMALSPSGEQHQLGLLLFTLFLRENGFSVVYIGPDTPLEGLEEMVVKHNFNLMCMSIASPKLMEVANRYMGALSKAKPEMQFILGGQGIDCKQYEGNRWCLGTDIKVWQQWLKEQNF
ncbi:B12-binding domain-containing protein [Planococcus halocryophilus]|nr:cobalamin-dependent protein [Planococcus halocryophilus]